MAFYWALSIYTNVRPKITLFRHALPANLKSYFHPQQHTRARMHMHTHKTNTKTNKQTNKQTNTLHTLATSPTAKMFSQCVRSSLLVRTFLEWGSTLTPTSDSPRPSVHALRPAVVKIQLGDNHSRLPLIQPPFGTRQNGGGFVPERGQTQWADLWTTLKHSLAMICWLSEHFSSSNLTNRLPMFRTWLLAC